jgi:hypothetical protein
VLTSLFLTLAERSCPNNVGSQAALINVDECS